MTQPRPAADGPVPDDEERELERARELLTRTMEFLARCMKDPKAALESDDPRELIDGLQALARPELASDAKPSVKDSPPIQIRRRRSA